jgi:hypothetical protein
MPGVIHRISEIGGSIVAKQDPKPQDPKPQDDKIEDGVNPEMLGEIESEFPGMTLVKKDELTSLRSDSKALAKLREKVAAGGDYCEKCEKVAIEDPKGNFECGRCKSKKVAKKKPGKK